MTHLLFPGRHHLLTNFQLEYLTLATSGDLRQLLDIDGEPLAFKEPIESVIWAVTSANHENTRRNPLPAHRREAAIEELADLLDVDSFVYMIDDIGSTNRFAEYVLKKIAVDSFGRFRLRRTTPSSAVRRPASLRCMNNSDFAFYPLSCSTEAPIYFHTKRRGS